MEQIITGLSKSNFHGAVNLVWQILNAGDSSIVRTRAMAEEYVKNNANHFRILEVGGEVQGLYTYKISDVHTINFFGLFPIAKRKRRGYALYKDMYEHLKSKPTFVIVFDNNIEMKKVLDKRAENVGKFLDKGGEVLNYYMLNFKDTGWKK